VTDDAPGVRVLLVEDSELDRELIEEELRRGDIECVVDWCNSPEGARAHLDCTRYDLVLTDHGLPGWDSTAVLKEIARRGLNTPTIVVTGTIGEERAAECLRVGATDFVLKTNLRRLPFAVRRALEDAQARREHAAALEQVRRLSVAVDQSPAASRASPATPGRRRSGRTLGSCAPVKPLARSTKGCGRQSPGATPGAGSS
jgi:DNA-binding NtrC family response regulator